jgi:hypothetical protein
MLDLVILNNTWRLIDKIIIEIHLEFSIIIAKNNFILKF